MAEDVTVGPRPDVEEQPTAAHAPRHYGFVDALRGIALLQVIFLHLSFGIPGELPPMLSNILSRGYAGVQLFFVVSAFTLCASLESRGSDTGAIRDFFVRRIFRIVPMFWTAILLYWLMQNVGPFWELAGPMGLRQYVLAVFLLHGFDVHGLNGVVPGGWSVAVEFSFYLLLPLLFRFASSLTRAVLLLVAAVAVSIAAMPLMQMAIGPHFAASEHEVIHQFAFYSLPTQLPVFCLGILVWRFLGPDRDRLGRVERWTRLGPRARAIFAALLVVTIGLPLNPFVWPPTMVRSIPGFLGYGALFALLVYALATFPLAVFDNRVTRYVGKVSYSAYLNQFVVLTITSRVFRLCGGLSPMGQLLAQTVFALTVTIGLSTVTYACIEEPGMAVGRRVIRWLRSRDVKAADAPATSHSR